MTVRPARQRADHRLAASRVRVFPDSDGLYRYLLRRGTDMGDSLIVELEGKLSDDVDFDADEGARCSSSRLASSRRSQSIRLGSACSGVS
jgi:hypothetical protein